MGYLSGNSGSIQFGEDGSVDSEANPNRGWKTSDTKITNWTMSTAATLLDTTSLGDYDKTSVYGLRTTSGTLKLHYYTSTVANDGRPRDNSASWFINALMRATQQTDSEYMPALPVAEESLPCRLRLYLNNKNSQSDYVELSANLNSVSYGSNVGELVSVDVSFEAIGPVRRSYI